MRIENSGVNFTQATGPAAQAQGSQPSHQGKITGGDSVRLSSFAQLAMSDSPMVPRLAAEYQAGRYNVPPQQIATSLIQETIER